MLVLEVDELRDGCGPESLRDERKRERERERENKASENDEDQVRCMRLTIEAPVSLKRMPCRVKSSPFSAALWRRKTRGESKWSSSKSSELIAVFQTFVRQL